LAKLKSNLLVLRERPQGQDFNPHRGPKHWAIAAIDPRPAEKALLILDRSRKLVENYDLFHAQSPDTGRGAHALSWRAKRDVDGRRWFLGFCLRVHLLALLLDGPYGEGEEAKSHKAKPERKSGEPQTLSGRILAGSLVPELKSGLKCFLAALVSGTNLRST